MIDRFDSLGTALRCVRWISDEGLRHLAAAIQAESYQREKEDVARATWHTFMLRRGHTVHVVLPEDEQKVIEGMGGGKGRGKNVRSACLRATTYAHAVKGMRRVDCKGCLRNWKQPGQTEEVSHSPDMNG